MTPGVTALVVSAVVFGSVTCGRTARRCSPAGADGAGPSGAAVAAHWATPPQVAAALVAAGLAGDPARWWRVALASVGLTVVAGGAAGGPGAAVVAGAGLAGSGALALYLARHRGARRADADLPRLLDHVARAARAGASLEQALSVAAAAVEGIHANEARRAVARVEQGASLDDALATWETAHPRPAPRLALAALGVAARAGGPQARALEAVATTLRSRSAVSGEAEAQASQALASAGVLVATPAAFAVLTGLADGRVAATLLRTPLGLSCIAGAGLLDAAGAWWMHHIVRSAR